MDFAKVRGIEVAGDWPPSQFFTALPCSGVLKPAQFFVGCETGDVSKNIRSRPEIRIPPVHRRGRD
jgi:hypothetical protein